MLLNASAAVRMNLHRMDWLGSLVVLAASYCGPADPLLIAEHGAMDGLIARPAGFSATAYQLDLPKL